MRIDPIKFIQGNLDSLHVLLDLIPLPVYVKDVNGKYLACNKSFEMETGLSLEGIVGKDVYEVWPKQQADIFDAHDKTLYENPDTQDVEIRVNAPAGDNRIVQFHKKIFYGVNQQAAGYLCVLFNITEKKATERFLQSQALTDELTQLPNRRAGLVRLAEELDEAERKNNSLCVALLDVDHFKKINDTYGHAVGDNALVAIAGILKSSLWGGDICARYGGEEFLICLPNTKIAQGLDVLERVRLACESCEIVTNDNKRLKVAVSIGVAQYPIQGATTQTLIKASDLALYQAKQAGRNRVMYLGK